MSESSISLHPKFFEKNKFFFVFLILVFIGGIASLFLYFQQKQIPKVPYLLGYRLVPEKISQSAKIPIFLPPGVDKEYAKGNIKFYPEIKGRWVKESKFFVFAKDGQNTIYFQPEEKLALNRYYLVELKTPEDKVIKGEFLAVEDPKIVAIFPEQNSEVPENSEITIVFNRPMVPLSELGFLEEKNIPVEISPKTEGKFKWTSTHNLQFIPKERLKRSSTYTVKVKDGLISMDGLKVEGQEIQFFTRKLRYLHLTTGTISYNQPISIHFNQPVDLERTKREITLINKTTGKEIEFIAEYSKKSKNQPKEDGAFGKINQLLANLLSSQREETDHSIIQIYPKKDRFGRKKLWDFENIYVLKIKKAYPSEGDIILDEERETEVVVAPIIQNIWAESPRTFYAEPQFFDPQGKLWVSFYEEIDLSKSKIYANHLKEINYGKKCKSQEEYCEEIPDRTKIFLIFKDQEIGHSETITINFEKIVNIEGLAINKEPFQIQIKSFPKFEIITTFPPPDSRDAGLTSLILCSNTPILSPSEEEYKNRIKANLDFEISEWGNSWKVERWWSDEGCDPGQFQTKLYLGLMPFSDYSFELDLEDVFGQKLKYQISFTTGPMPYEHMDFYHLQPSYNVTTPQKTKLTFATKNFDYVKLQICKVSAPNFLYLLKENLWYEPIPISKCERIIEDKIELPKRYWIKNYFQVDLQQYFSNPIGYYILTFSHPRYLTEIWKERKYVTRNVFERTYLNVTNLGVGEKRINLRDYFEEDAKIPPEKLSDLYNLYWITDISTLEPVAGAKIDLYDENLNIKGTFYSNKEGIAKVPPQYEIFGIVVSKGEDSAIIPPYQSKFEWVERALLAKRIYLYTDKPIYRPGQEVFVKGIYRIGYDAAYEIDKRKTINLKVYNSKGEEILDRDLNLNEFGTFNTSFFLDKDAPLGNYRICAENFQCTFIDVQEYLPASFEVRIKKDKEEYVSKDKLNLEIEARYYFGVPLEGGEVEYTISTQNYYFDRYEDENFKFGKDWYYWGPYEYEDKFLLRGKTQLSSEGKALISQELDLEKLFNTKEERKSKIVIVDVTVKNTQGQSISAQESFILHAGEFYLGVKTDKYFVGKDENFNVRIKSVNPQGKEIKVKGINLEVYKVDWIYAKRQEMGGGWGYRWEKKRELIERKTFDTDGKGNYTLEMKLGKEGEYEFEVSARDQRGNLIWDTSEIYVYGRGEVTVKPTSDTQLEIEPEKKDFKVGEEARFIVKSPYKRAKALITIERGKIFDYQIREIVGNIYPFSFTIQEEYIPNIFVSVLLQSSEPEVKFGKVELSVGKEKREIEIEVKSNKKYYLPGEEVILEIFTKDKNGNPLSAEVSVAVVDLSVLALKGNPKKNPLIFFYSGFPLTVQTSSNIKNILVSQKIPLTKGGGGFAEEMLARKARGLFKETAFWEAVLRTNEQGFAQIKFTLPDNLTTWQTEVLGVTKDTKLGVAYHEFITKKELMVVPLKPRFVVPGDEFFVGAQVFNQTKENQEIKITLESETLILEEKNEKRVNLDPEKSTTVYFKVKAPPEIESGEHKFLISAKTDGLEDTVIQFIKITPNHVYETVATSNYTSRNISKEYIFLPEYVVKDRGGVTIKSSATLAVFLSDALNYLIEFPYGCSEQIASRLNAIAIVKRALNVPNLSEKFQLKPVKYEGKEYSLDELVEIGLAKLYNNQQFDGGFSFWREGNSNFYVTLHVVNTLHNLSLAGYKINPTVLERAGNYLLNEITKNPFIYENKNNFILAAYTLSNLKDFSQNKFLKEKITEILKDENFLRERISNSTLSYLAILLVKGNYNETLKKKVFEILDSRLNLDARGAFLEPKVSPLWDYFETPIKDTALYLKAQIAARRETPALEKVLRWILNSRNKDGAWGSTHNTLAVIDALTDLLEWKKETESNFKIQISLNEREKANFHFEPKTILEQIKIEVPLRELKFNEISTLTFIKENLNDLSNSYYYDIFLRYYLPAERIPPRDEGFTIERSIFALDDIGNKNPLKEAKVGEILRVNLKITVPSQRKYIAIEDFIPAGMEIVNLDLATEQKSLRLRERELGGREIIPDFKELRDDRAFFFKEELWPGVYEIEYFVRPLIKGKFTHLPATVFEMYFPENFGRTSAGYFEIK